MLTLFALHAAQLSREVIVIAILALWMETVHQAPVTMESVLLAISTRQACCVITSTVPKTLTVLLIPA